MFFLFLSLVCVMHSTKRSKKGRKGKGRSIPMSTKSSQPDDVADDGMVMSGAGSGAGAGAGASAGGNMADSYDVGNVNPMFARLQAAKEAQAAQQGLVSSESMERTTNQLTLLQQETARLKAENQRLRADLVRVCVCVRVCVDGPYMCSLSCLVLACPCTYAWFLFRVHWVDFLLFHTLTSLPRRKLGCVTTLLLFARSLFLCPSLSFCCRPWRRPRATKQRRRT